MGNLNKGSNTYRERRPIDVIAKPPLPPVDKRHRSLLGLTDDWTTALTEAEEWPYPDPDANGLADPEPSFTDYPSDPALVPADIEPFSHDEPWGMMVNESSRAYEEFSHYRSLGITRTRKAVADQFKIARQTVDQMAARYNWDARARAWDEYRERVYTTELLLGVKDMAHKHAEIAREGVEALSIAFSGIIERMKDPEDRAAFIDEIADLPVKTQLALAANSARVIPGLMNAERLSRGLPTEISLDLHQHDARVIVQTTDDLADILLGLSGPLAVARSGEAEGEIIDVEPRGD
jgi:hypothetical protein